MMEETDTRWQERCERYFSSMIDVRQRQKIHPSPGELKRADLYRVDEDGHSLENGPGHPHHYNNYVTTFSRKKHPAKGLLKWLTCLDLHGTSMLIRARSCFYCVFWISLSVLATGIFCVGAYLLVNEYLDSSYKFKQDVSNNGTNASPLSLLVCNSNRIRKSKVETGTRFQSLLNITLDYLNNVQGTVQNTNKESISDLLRNTNLRTFLQKQRLEDLSSAVLNQINHEFNFYGQMNSSFDWLSLARSLTATNMNPFINALQMTSLELQDVGHGMEDSILQCSKNGRQCEPSEISYIPTLEMGNCAVVYMSLGDSYFERLTLMVDVEQEDYIDLISPSPGIRVIVQSSSSSSPPSFIQSTLVTAGDGLQMSLSKRVETKRQTSRCNDDPNYNRQECVSRCQQLHTAQTCGCSVSLESPLAQRCQVNVQYQFVCQRFLQVLTDRNLLPCQCQPPCREESITVTKTNFQWLTDKTEPLIRTHLEQTLGTLNSSELRKSLVAIDVVWDPVPFLALQQEDETELWQLLLQLGALSAITVGISMVTGLELVWLIGKAFMLLSSIVFKSSKKKDGQVQRVYLPPEIYPEFDNISWRDFPKETSNKMDTGGVPLRPSDSALNRRRVQVQGYPTPFNARHEERNQNQSDTFFYQGRDSGFVYGYEPNAGTQPFLQEEPDSMFQRYDNVNRDEDLLFGKSWERTGDSRAIQRVLVSHEEVEGNGVPFLNGPGGTILNEPINNVHDNDVSDDDDLRLPLPLESFEQERSRHNSQEMDRTRQTSHDFMDRTRQSSQDIDDRSRQTLHDKDRTRHALDKTDQTVNFSVELDDQNPSAFHRPMKSAMNLKLADGDEQPERANVYRVDHRTHEPVFAISGKQVWDATNIGGRARKIDRGPDLSRFHPAGEALLPFHKSKHNQSNSRHASSKGNKGLTRTKESKTRPLNETTPAFGNFFPRSKIVTPYTWHNAGNDGPVRNFVPSAYMTSGYDGRTAIYRPQGSHFGVGGSAIRNENGETFYIHT